MSFLSWLGGGNDRQLAEEQYAGRESASGRASRKRRERYHSGGATRAARKGQAWDDASRRRERQGGSR
ncbi:hypothetical protein [Streptomyces sp. NRRL F-5630]|uniref:hypothetical protein n=1 Tax=Streptomyces sp. NRRL F-5630 TaxID=1463864 RepID=UPI003D741E06